MGACASVPKDMKNEDAPPPETPKEEVVITTTEVPEVKADDKEAAVVEGEEKNAEGGDENDKDGEDVKHQSLGSFLNESEEPKESPKTEKTTPLEAENAVEQQEESEAALPVSVEASAVVYVAPVARVTTEEEKETEVKQ